MINIKNKNLIKNLFNKKTLILFSANWCTPCKILEKKIKIIEKKSNLFFFKINVDIFCEEIINLNIKNIPTFLINNKKKIFFNGINSIKKIIFLIKKYF